MNFVGHRLTEDGLKPDPLKVKARHMPLPKSEAELDTVHGMVTYLAKFAPNLSELTAPLRQLLKQDTALSDQKLGAF